jgi:hypothetical protein
VEHVFGLEGGREVALRRGGRIGSAGLLGSPWLVGGCYVVVAKRCRSLSRGTGGGESVHLCWRAWLVDAVRIRFFQGAAVAAVVQCKECGKRIW